MGYLGDGDERRSMGLHGQGDQPQSSDGMLCVLSAIDVLKWVTMPSNSYVSLRIARKLIWNTGVNMLASSACVRSAYGHQH